MPAPWIGIVKLLIKSVTAAFIADKASNSSKEKCDTNKQTININVNTKKKVKKNERSR